MLSPLLKIHLEHQLSDFLGEEIKINSFTSIGGGSINQSYCITSNKNEFFLKTNKAGIYPKMFETETKALELLRSNSTFRIPLPYFTGEHQGETYLLMEYLSSAHPTKNFWHKFGKLLAALHKNTAATFGLEYNNYIGSLLQINTTKSSWADFFIENRVSVQEKIAVDSGKIDSSTRRKLQKLYREIPSLFPDEVPSLLHGDLWSGNYMLDENAHPVILDPAIYYGHREMDIGMTKLFGGFDAEMYASYNSEFPLEKGWEERVDLCNLYPLLVHVNLFGGSYILQVNNILKKFT